MCVMVASLLERRGRTLQKTLMLPWGGGEEGEIQNRQELMQHASICLHVR